MSRFAENVERITGESIKQGAEEVRELRKELPS
jgi:hypothetical protein